MNVVKSYCVFLVCVFCAYTLVAGVLTAKENTERMLTGVKSKTVTLDRLSEIF